MSTRLSRPREYFIRNWSEEDHGLISSWESSLRIMANTSCPDHHVREMRQMFRSHLKKYLTLDFKWNVLLKLAFVCNSSLMFPRFIIPLLANLAPGTRGILRPAIRSSAPRLAVGVYFSRARTRPRLWLVRRAVRGCDWLAPVVRQCVTRPQQLPRAYIGSGSGRNTWPWSVKWPAPHSQQ